MKQIAKITDLPMKLSLPATIGFGVLGFVIVGVLDLLVGFEIDLLLLHLLPVLFVTWYAGARWGVLFAVLTVGLLAYPDIRRAVSGELRTVHVVDAASDMLALLMIVFLQTKLRQAYDRTHAMSRTDALTGCLNRAGFMEVLSEEIARKRRLGHPFSLTFFDCDNFKQVNDTFGHAAGDAVLVQAAATLRANLRAIDAVGRLGGDEFAALLPATNAEAAQRTLEHVKEALDAAMRHAGWQVSFSIGVAAFSRTPACAEEALQLSDGLMYEAKQGGKNRILVHEYC